MIERRIVSDGKHVGPLTAIELSVLLADMPSLEYVEREGWYYVPAHWSADAATVSRATGTA